MLSRNLFSTLYLAFIPLTRFGKNPLSALPETRTSMQGMFTMRIGLPRMMEQLLKKRKRLNPVRLELSRDLHKSIRRNWPASSEFPKNMSCIGGTPLDLSYMFTLQNTMREHQEWYTRGTVQE